LKTIEDDPIYDTKQAKKKLKKYVENSEFTIRKKTEIMIEHFINNVKSKINHEAKVMVVTSSIIQALKYYFSFRDVIKENNLHYKAIVAFSGKKEYEGIEYDEDKLNSFPSNDIPKTFKKQEYKFLIVANKFQTGFDEPRLQTIYVDKKLEGVQAVQTLSRLNRCYKPHKTETFVLDFYNQADEIREAFQPYYETTVLSEETDRNRLNELLDALDNAQVYTTSNVNEFIELLFNNAHRDDLENYLDKIVENYSTELDEDHRIEFKQNAVSYCRTYTFLSQISNFKNPYYEKLNLFINLLHRKLPRIQNADFTEDLLQAIDLDSYRNQKTVDKTDIKLTSEDGVIDPLNPTLGGSGIEREFDPLSQILNDFNNRFGTNWTEEDKRFLFKIIPETVMQDEEIMNVILQTLLNKDVANAKTTSDKKVKDVMEDQLHQFTALYKMFATNTEFKNYINSYVFNKINDTINTKRA
jgi:type I restriction enzyme R subunit